MKFQPLLQDGWEIKAQVEESAQIPLKKMQEMTGMSGIWPEWAESIKKMQEMSGIWAEQKMQGMSGIWAEKKMQEMRGIWSE